jgi:hypothetical protein
LACRQHRAALVAFVDRREEGPGTPAALVHLDRCRNCRAELESIALTIIALHRLAGSLDRIAPSGAAAPPVGRRWRMRMPRLTLAGPLLATAIAVVLLFPAVSLHSHVMPQTDAAPALETTSQSRQLNAEYLPVRATGSARFWTYGTYGLTAQVLWPPSGPSRHSPDPEQARFDLRSAGRVPGAWSGTGEVDDRSGPAAADDSHVAGPVNAEAI